MASASFSPRGRSDAAFLKQNKAMPNQYLSAPATPNHALRYRGLSSSSAFTHRWAILLHVMPSLQPPTSPKQEHTEAPFSA